MPYYIQPGMEHKYGVRKYFTCIYTNAHSEKDWGSYKVYIIRWSGGEQGGKEETEI